MLQCLGRVSFCSTQRDLDNISDGRQQHPEEPGETNQEEQKKTWGEWIQDMKHFIWNPEKKEVLGRDKRSWALILLFYSVLYCFLAGMFALCMYGLLATISPYVPTYRERVFPPGLTIRPQANALYFAFNSSERSTWSSYAESLNTFLEDYNDETQKEKNLVCTPGKYFLQPGEDHEERKACQFSRSLLRNCSGIEDPSFGFAQGKPCILIKMNRILGYQAGSGIPIYVTCEVLKADMSYLGPISFYPSDKFDLMYYPYYGKLTHVNYTSPLIAMQFTGVKRNEDVNVQCKINGKDIISDHEKDRFLGRVAFTLHIA
ncbi:protein ATP1B4 isoform X2 [Xenopus tropicalis]|uniref:Sodium/potassium-transporting ATPase subunit beta n=1 Tax=Xenopus tropicalis TaxID=8364 RepID=A0A6I8SFQ3_XENTR|nr:protein ATP1B4 isoform X2 [Xenopus tropicalis]|eukprot:XP_004915808.1 PREDICTED: protein ATP1B4 isoform X2 [Xenopus tropicalis]